jgi:hypothetical protein
LCCKVHHGVHNTLPRKVKGESAVVTEV